jgi:Ni,Fe-hydrogenase I large subunit
MASTAPMARDTSVAVTPLARYLLSTIITNKEGARAQIPMIKLLTNSMAAVFLSRNRYKIRLFIIVVFNDFTI